MRLTMLGLIASPDALQVAAAMSRPPHARVPAPPRSVYPWHRSRRRMRRQPCGSARRIDERAVAAHRVEPVGGVGGGTLEGGYTEMLHVDFRRQLTEPGGR